MTREMDADSGAVANRTDDALLRDAAGRAIGYLAGLDPRALAAGAAALERLVTPSEAIPDNPSDPASVLALLDEIGSPATTATAGGRFFGYVVGGSRPAALAAPTSSPGSTGPIRGQSMPTSG